MKERILILPEFKISDYNAIKKKVASHLGINEKELHGIIKDVRIIHNRIALDVRLDNQKEQKKLKHLWQEKESIEMQLPHQQAITHSSRMIDVRDSLQNGQKDHLLDAGTNYSL